MRWRPVVVLGIAAIALGLGLTYVMEHGGGPEAERTEGPPTTTDLPASAATLEGRVDVERVGTAQEQPAGRTFEGRIVDAETGDPVEGAKVQVFEYTTGRRTLLETDADGRYAAPDVGSDGRSVAVAVESKAHGRRLHLRVATGGDPARLELEPGGWIEGRVVDEEGGVPVGLALRALERPYGGPHASGVHDATLRHTLPPDLVDAPTRYGLDAAGHFRVGPLAEGLYILLLTPAEGPPRAFLAGGKTYDPKAGYAVKPGETTDAGTLTLPALGHVRFRVLDATTDTRLPGVEFTYETNLDHRRRVAPATGVTVTEEGDYRVPLVLDAKRPVVQYHTVGIACEGYVSTTQSFGYQKNGSGMVVRLLPTASSASLRGRVLDERGQPLAGALVVLRTGADHVGRLTTATDAAGRYALGGIPPGIEMHAIVLAPDLENVLSIVSLRFEPGETRELDLGGPQATALAVEVRHRGEPLEGAFLSLDTTDDKRTQLRSGPDGRVRFDGIPTGRHELFVSVLDEKGMLTLPAVVEAGMTTSLVLDFRHELRGTFRLEDTEGNPLPIQPYLTLAARRPTEGGDLVAEGQVAEDGSFVLLLTDPGTYRLETSDHGDPVQSMTDEDIEVPVEGPVDELEVVWRMQPKDGRIEIEVLQVADDAPITEGDYRYRWRTTRGASIFEEGRIVREGLGLGEHTFIVQGETYAPETIRVLLTAEARDVRRTIRLPKSNGVQLLEFLPDSRAKAAGLRPGDVVTAYGETPVLNGSDLQAALRATTAEEQVRLTILRAGRKVQIDTPGGRMGVTWQNARVD